MKILALNSSPRMDRGGTALILNAFIEGAKEASADVELVYLRKLSIKPCQGCFTCWIRTPGQCIQNDEMKNLLQKIGDADVLVLATPVYVDGMTSTMKAVVDRMIPLVEPYFEIRNDHCRHPPRKELKSKKMVLVSVSGFTELDNFDSLVHHVRAISKNMNAEYVGALLRPVGSALLGMKRMGIEIDDVLVAAKHAGIEVVQNGQISKQVMKTVSRELVPRADYIRVVNESFQRQIDELKQ